MNIFKQLAEGMENNKVSYTIENEGSDIELNGVVRINKCGLKRDYHWHARIYNASEGIAGIDDWDGDFEDVSFNGIKIDDYDKFIKGFREHGLSSVAESLEITRNELRDIVYQAVINHKTFKTVYKKHKLWNSMTSEEMRSVYYNHVMNGKNIGMYNMNDMGWTKDGVMFTKEEVEQYEKERV
jgi:hypothetical protein